MPRFRITETVMYEVEAESPLDAYEKVFNGDNGTVTYFTGVTDRSIERHNPDRAVWVPIDEPEEWSA